MPAKRGRKRGRQYNKNFFAIPLNETITLSTLGSNTIISANSPSAGFLRPCFIYSVKAQWAMLDHVVTEGPLDFGYANSDLTVTELQEGLDAEVLDPDNIIEMERAGRPIRRAGIFNGLSTEEVFNDGKSFKTKCSFTLGVGGAVECWIRNSSGDPLTGSTLVRVFGMIYGKWI